MSFSNCGRTFILNFIAIQKQEPLSISAKSIYRYLKIKAQTSVEIQALGFYELCTVGFDDMLLSKQGDNMNLLSTVIVILTLYLRAFLFYQKILYEKIVI